jgi:metal-responsive CopG/Arc/MetJ family transcriptional regulator
MMRKRKKSREMRVTAVRLPHELWNEIVSIAEKELRPASSVIRRALIEWLKNYKKDK